MPGGHIPYASFRQKLAVGDNIYENNFYIENDDVFDDCWIGFAPDCENPYWFGLTADGKNACDFKTVDEILNAKVFNGKSMYELWNKVYFYTVNGIEAKDWFLNNCVDFNICRLKDACNVAKLAVKLWNDADYNELKKEFEDLVQSGSDIIFTAYFQSEMIAFAHCSVRNEYVEGANTNHVAYLEAIYVAENFRRNGIGGFLIKNCENWAKKQGITEFASDCSIYNAESINMHKASGFSESAKLIHFIKNI